VPAEDTVTVGPNRDASNRSAAGDRQMFPVQTTRTEKGICRAVVMPGHRVVIGCAWSRLPPDGLSGHLPYRNDTGSDSTAGVFWSCGCGPGELAS
jgi:hypothetical protein